MPTPHIEANVEDIAEIVLMPGDPLRAKYIAEKYLENAVLVNKVRNMFCYTGYYKGVKLSVMGSGMGMPSTGIYSYELFKFYNVKTIIRIGSCGTYTNKLSIADVLLVTSAFSDSNYAKIQNNEDRLILNSDNEVNEEIRKTAILKNVELYEGTIHSSDVFYQEKNNYKELVDKYNVLGVEMESFALFHNANVLNKKATCLLTVSDSFVSDEKMTREEREKSLNRMIELALDSIITFDK